MKKMIIIVAIISALMVALPVTVVKKSDFKEKNTQSAIGTSISQNATNKKDYFRVYDKKSDSITVMSADDYIFGVVSAEMPALYHTEALKAQAVAAYTYACYKRNQNKDKKYDITTDYTVDQSFKSYNQACDDWGKNADEYAKKIKEAVKFVSGQIMV